MRILFNRLHQAAHVLLHPVVSEVYQSPRNEEGNDCKDSDPGMAVHVQIIPPFCEG